MTIKLSTYADAKENFNKVSKSTEASAEEKSKALNDMMDALQRETRANILEEAQALSSDNTIMQARGHNVLTSDERKFFNEVVEFGGFDDDAILPVTTQERIFEELQKEHPLLGALGIQDLGAVTRYIYSEAENNFAWGELFGPIAGQIAASFREEEVSQLKLTAFAVIPNDMLELGPTWVERYVREVAVETISVGLEYGFVNGRGRAQNEPVGLMKDVSDNGAVTDKESSGTLTFTPSDRGEIIAGELYEVISNLSVNEEGENRKVNGRVVMVVNPVDAIAVQFRNTIQTANGQWVTSLPYNIRTVESEEVPVGKALFFVQGEYIAAVAGGYRLKKFDQTLAMEDATLYTIKQFANGLPKDNKAALVYDLNINFGGEETP